MEAVATLSRRLASSVTAGPFVGYVPTLSFVPFEPTGETCIACPASLEGSRVARVNFKGERDWFSLCPECLCLSDEKLRARLSAKAAMYQGLLGRLIREGRDTSCEEWLAPTMAKLAAHGFLVDPEGIQAWLDTIPVCCHQGVRAQVEAAVLGASL